MISFASLIRNSKQPSPVAGDFAKLSWPLASIHRETRSRLKRYIWSIVYRLTISSPDPVLAEFHRTPFRQGLENVFPISILIILNGVALVYRPVVRGLFPIHAITACYVDYSAGPVAAALQL